MKTGAEIYHDLAEFADLPAQVSALRNGRLRRLITYLGSLKGELAERESQVLAAAICSAAARFLRGPCKGKGKSS